MSRVPLNVEPVTNTEKRRAVVFLAAVAAECRRGALDAPSPEWAALELAQAAECEALIVRLLAAYRAPRQPKENP